MILVFDTETTGLPKSNLPINHPSQPRLVQLAAILYDEKSQNELACLSVVIKPDGWEMDPKAMAIHGITIERANVIGVPVISALSLFSHLCGMAKTLVAHNLDFDLQIVRGEFARLGKGDRTLGRAMYCTMKAATDIVKLPGRGGGHKWPKLAETYKHFTGNELDNAHDALVDARACAEIYWSLMREMKGELTMMFDEMKQVTNAK